MTTINISLPDAMYEDAKKMLTKKNYASINALIQDGLKKLLYKKILTVNGFTEKFEEDILRKSAEPIEKDIVLETEEDARNFFLYLKTPKRKEHKHDKS